MFGSIRKSFTKFVEGISSKLGTREIKAEDLEEPLNSLLLELAESDVAYSTAEQIVSNLKSHLLGKRIRKEEDVSSAMMESLKELIMNFVKEPNFDMIDSALNKCKERKEPYVVVFMGVNGVGKTTSIAKVAYMAKKRGLTPLIVAGDTFRAGSQEQLEVHANRIGVPIIKAKYGSDSASVVFDAINYAKKRNICLVLVDTAGRMHIDKDLVEELKKVIRVASPDLKLLVIDSLTGNDAVEQAKKYDEEIGVDGYILTKADADTKGGSALSVAFETGKPIMFVGVGQNYEDIIPFSKNWLISLLLGKGNGEGKEN
ncbi:MAG: signal recognition particle-docking protein FtsY [Fervidicoccaceae archaeon]|jgi:fused signal recognition particle receptor